MLTDMIAHITDDELRERLNRMMRLDTWDAMLERIVLTQEIARRWTALSDEVFHGLAHER